MLCSIPDDDTAAAAFEYLRRSFAGLAAAIESYRTLGDAVQNPGATVNVLELHGAYVAARQAVIDALQRDLVQADEVMRQILHEWLGPLMQASAPSPTSGAPAAPPARARGQGEDWQRAIADIDAALSDIDDIPEAGQDFASSVQEKLEGMRRWIEDNGKVTEKMLLAIDNMHSGILRWTERDE